MNYTPFNTNNLTIVQPEVYITKHQISLLGVILYFVIYLAVHILLGVMKQNEEKIQNDNEEHLERLKLLQMAFKWWPFVYVFIIVLTNI